LAGICASGWGLRTRKLPLELLMQLSNVLLSAASAQSPVSNIMRWCFRLTIRETPILLWPSLFSFRIRQKCSMHILIVVTDYSDQINSATREDQPCGRVSSRFISVPGTRRLRGLNRQRNYMGGSHLQSVTRRIISPKQGQCKPLQFPSFPLQCSPMNPREFGTTGAKKFFDSVG